MKIAAKEIICSNTRLIYFFFRMLSQDGHEGRVIFTSLQLMRM